MRSSRSHSVTRQRLKLRFESHPNNTFGCIDVGNNRSLERKRNPRSLPIPRFLMPLERNSPMSERVRAASVNDLSEETGLELALKGKIIALYKVDDEVLAMDGICPHAGGPLGKGTVTNG